MFNRGGGGGGGGGGGEDATGASHYFLQSQQQMFHAALDADGIGMDSAFMGATGGGGLAAPDTHAHSNALLYNLSVLKDKVQQLQPLVGLAVGHDGHGHLDPVAPGASAIIQEIIAAASSMLYAFQHLCGGLGASLTSVNNAALGAQEQEGVVGAHAKNGAIGDVNAAAGCSGQQAMDQAMHQWQQQQHHGDGQHENYYEIHGKSTASSSSMTAMDTIIIELDAAELLAKYTHYCQVCGKGFKRDANLRMHMRAHGDEYKSKAALANPLTNKFTSAAGEDAAAAMEAAARRNKYSCPQVGCRWNRKHAKFQPLKSVICVKNHYKRSHCPKMYICNRCNRKHFSVLSDLRTHEKHCGDHRWICSCGTTFSRKDKLAGHVSLFAGHEPVVVPMAGRHGKKSSSTSADQVDQLRNCTGGFSIT